MIGVHYQYILFDYDGCISDTVSPWAQAIKEAAAEFGLVLNGAQIREQFGQLGNAKYHGLSEALVPAYSKRVKELARGGVFAAKLHDDAYELLKYLNDDNRAVALVSTNSIGLTDILAQNGILQFFEIIISGNDVRQKKPDPEGINAALRILRCDDRSSAVMIGDSEHDLGAAKNARIDSILFYSGGTSSIYGPEELKELERSFSPKHTVRSHAELKSILSRSRC